jgi:hypothetical protein
LPERNNFLNVNNPLMDIKEIIGQHSQSVALVFKNLGIKAPVTTKEILFATLVYQDRFIDALVQQIAIDNNEYTGYSDGTEIPVIFPTGTKFPKQGNKFGQTQTLPDVVVKSKAAKKSLWDILGSVADNAAKIITATKSGNQPVYIPTEQTTPRSNNGINAGAQKWWLIGGIGLLVVLIIVYINQRGK